MYRAEARTLDSITWRNCMEKRREAASSSENEANTIVRRLQAADEQASRGSAETESFANRPQPE